MTWNGQTHFRNLAAKADLVNEVFHLNSFAKRSVLNVWQDPAYSSVTWLTSEAHLSVFSTRQISGLSIKSV